MNNSSVKTDDTNSPSLSIPLPCLHYTSHKFNPKMDINTSINISPPNEHINNLSNKYDINDNINKNDKQEIISTKCILCAEYLHSNTHLKNHYKQKHSLVLNT